MQVSYWLGEMGKPWYKMSHHLGTKCPTTLVQNVPPPWYKMSHHLGTEYSGVLGARYFVYWGQNVPPLGWVNRLLAR